MKKKRGGGGGVWLGRAENYSVGGQVEQLHAYTQNYSECWTVCKISEIPT